jgi:hypothetical protein
MTDVSVTTTDGGVIDDRRCCHHERRVGRRDRRGRHHDPAGRSQGLALRSRSPTQASSRNQLSLLVARRRGFDGLGPLPGAAGMATVQILCVEVLVAQPRVESCRFPSPFAEALLTHSFVFLPGRLVLGSGSTPVVKDRRSRPRPKRRLRRSRSVPRLLVRRLLAPRLLRRDARQNMTSGVVLAVVVSSPRTSRTKVSPRAVMTSTGRSLVK